MDKLIIQNTIKFLERTDLKGKEVSAYIECIKWLTELKNNLKDENK